MALQEVLTHFGFTVDASQLKRADVGVQGLTAKLKGLGGMVTAAATAFVGAELVGAVRSMIDNVTQQIDALNDVANQLDVSTGFLEQYGYAAQMSGSSAESLTTGLRKLSLAAADAAQGGAETAKVFSDLGIDVKNAEGQVKPLEQLFPSIVSEFSKIPKGAEQARAAVKLFGKGGVELIPLLNEGEEGVAKLRQEFEELHGTMSTTLIEDTAEMRDNLDRFGYATKGLQIQLVSFLVPALSKLAVWAAKGIGLFREWSGRIQLFERIGRVAMVGMLALVAKFAPAIIAATASLAPLVLGWLALFLIVDDFISFLEGEGSAMADLLDAWFGAGTAEQVRAWFFDLEATVSNFWADFKEGAFINLDSVLGVFLMFCLDAGNGFERLRISVGIIINGIAIDFQTKVLEMQNSWNAFVGGLSLPAELKSKLTVDTSGQIGKLTAAQTQQTLNADRLRHEEQGQLRNFRQAFGGESAFGNVAPTAAVATGPVKAPVTTTNYVELAPQVSVTVPPGTSAAQAKFIAREASRAVRDTTRATMASLEPTK
jgi:hypothetical protein